MKPMPGLSAPADLSSASLQQKIHYTIATTGWTGHLPASGTWGAMVAFLLHVTLFPHAFTLDNPFLALGILILVIVVGTWVSETVERMTGKKDDSRVTVDEVAGYFLAVLFLPAGLEYTIPAFILARGFDIIKPPPANALQSLRGGVGIMVDDLIASVYALVLMHLYAWMGFGEWVRAMVTGDGS